MSAINKVLRTVIRESVVKTKDGEDIIVTVDFDKAIDTLNDVIDILKQ